MHRTYSYTTLKLTSGVWLATLPVGYAHFREYSQSQVDIMVTSLAVTDVRGKHSHGASAVNESFVK